MRYIYLLNMVVLKCQVDSCTEQTQNRNGFHIVEWIARRMKF